MSKKIKIFHDLDDLEYNVEYEMNLKDNAILKDNTVNNEEDILLNSNLYKNEEDIFYRNNLKNREEKLMEADFLLKKRNVLDEYDSYDEIKKGFYLNNLTKNELEKKDKTQKIKKMLNIEENKKKEKVNNVFDNNSQFFIKNRQKDLKETDFSFLKEKNKNSEDTKEEKKTNISKKSFTKKENSKKLKIDEFIDSRYNSDRIECDKKNTIELRGKINLENSTIEEEKKNIIKEDLIAFEEISEEENENIKIIKKTRRLIEMENGSKSILEIKLPSEQLFEQKTDFFIDEKTKKDLEKIPDNIFEEEQKVDDFSENTFAALEYLKKKGLLQQKKKEQITLEYKDHKGRILEGKQAFNQFVWGYYGQKPSVSKILKLEKKQKFKNAGNNNLNSNKIGKVLEVAQNVTNKPFLNISDLPTNN